MTCTSLYRSIYCYKRIPAQYDDTGQKESQLSLHRVMGNDFLFILKFKNDLWLKIFKITSFRLLDLQSSTGKSE